MQHGSTVGGVGVAANQKYYLLDKRKKSVFNKISLTNRLLNQLGLLTVDHSTYSNTAACSWVEMFLPRSIPCGTCLQKRHFLT